MAYFKIGNTDYSQYVCQLAVTKKHNYTSQTNAAGNTVVDYLNSKRVIDVGIISLPGSSLTTLMSAISGLSVTISFLNPTTGTLETNVACMLAESNVSYYTIQANNVRAQNFNLKFVEL